MNTMFDSFFNFLEKFVSDFSWRRLITFLLFLLLIIGALLLYDKYTDNSRLNKIERSTALLKELASLHNQIAQDSTLLPIYLDTTKRLHEIVNEHTTMPAWLYIILKGFFGALPWLICVFAILPSVKRGDNPPNTILGAGAFAVIFGVIGMFIPDFGNSYISFAYYPIGHFLIVATLLYSYESSKKKKLITQDK
jgi:hypothetical protein